MVILIKVTFSSKQRRKISGIFQIFLPRYPSQGTPSHANSRDKKSLNSSTQAKLEEWLEEQHRQGAVVQPYPVIT